MVLLYIYIFWGLDTTKFVTFLKSSGHFLEAEAKLLRFFSKLNFTTKIWKVGKLWEVDANKVGSLSMANHPFFLVDQTIWSFYSVHIPSCSRVFNYSVFPHLTVVSQGVQLVYSQNPFLWSMIAHIYLSLDFLSGQIVVSCIWKKQTSITSLMDRVQLLKFWVVFWLTSKGWKAQPTKEPLSGFEPTISGLVVHHLNHYLIAI